MGSAGVKMDIKIRMATEGDAEALLAIYAPYVEKTPVSFECEVPSVEEFAGRIRQRLEKYPYLVALIDEKIVGYAYASPFHSRAAFGWGAELSIYVHWDKRGCGIGGVLYDRLEELLKEQGILNLNSCIAWPNPESVGFHEKRGFREVGHFHQCGYKLGEWHDVIWMEKMLGEHKNPPDPVKGNKTS